MEQTALRPKPMPGQKPGGGRPSGTGRRPHAAPRRARQRLITLLFTLITCTVLVLSGVGLGTMAATVIGMSRLAELREGAGVPQPSAGWGGSGRAQPGSSASPPETPDEGGPVPAHPTLGIEAVDAPGGAGAGGALLVGVHVPGPGYHAGLVRGDVVLALGGTRIGSAADLARAIAAARPGVGVKLVVRHANGNRQHLAAVPGVVT